MADELNLFAIKRTMSGLAERMREMFPEFANDPDFYEAKRFIRKAVGQVWPEWKKGGERQYTVMLDRKGGEPIVRLCVRGECLVF